MRWASLAGGLMFLAVALGAFGAHGLRNKLDAPAIEIYQTAVFYHIVHSLALFLVALSLGQFPSDKLRLAAYLFVSGIVLFSGSLYLLSFTGLRWLGAVTPFGGFCFLAGWAALAAAFYRG